MRPWSMIILGFFLCLSGVVLPFLMVIHTLQSTFFLNFFAYGASIGGMFLGLIGASRVAASRNRNRDK